MNTDSLLIAEIRVLNTEIKHLREDVQAVEIASDNGTIGFMVFIIILIIALK